MLTRAVPRSGPGACLPRSSPRCRLATSSHGGRGLATAAVACSAGTWLGATLLERDRRSPRYLTPRVRSVRFQTSADSPPGNSAHSHLTQSCSFLYTTAAELTCPVSRPPAAFRPTAASEVLPVCTQSRTDRPPADAARQWKDLSL